MKKKELKIISNWLTGEDTIINGSSKNFTIKEIQYLKDQFEFARMWLVNEHKEKVNIGFSDRELEYLIKVLRRAVDEKEN